MSTPNLNDLQLRPYPETAQDFHHVKQAAECVRESAEEWYMQTRKEVGDSRLRLEPVVLKPLPCDDCASAMGAATPLEKLLDRNKSQSELVPLLPINPRPNRVRFYDRSSRLLYLERHQTPPPDWFSVTCSMCGQRVDSKDGDDIIRVGEESFADYFGLPNPTDEDYTPRNKPRGTASVRTSSTLGRYSSAIRAACANERSCGSARGAISNGRPYRDLVDPLVSESGTPNGLRRERSLQAYDGVVNVVGNPSPAISSVPKPLPTRWSKRVSAATSFMRPFAPCFGKRFTSPRVYLVDQCGCT